MGSLTTVFAAAGPISGTEANPAQAVITKELKMPDGTVTPAETFTFTLAKKDVDGDTTTAALATMPAIGSQTVTFTGAETGTTASGVKTVTGETASLFAGVTFPHAGVYTYTVTEAAGSTTGMTYSQASYDVSVYVANGTSGLYVAAIGTTVVIVDHTGQAVGDKTDPTTSTNVSGAYSAMVFTNTYVKKTGGTDVTDPADQTLAISKTVSGDYGDQTKYFAYSVTVTQSALATGTTYKGYVVENGAVVTAAANGTIGGTDPTNGAYISFPSGTAVTVNLKHGQTLAFIDNEVGSSYVAVESAVADYTADVSIVVNGATAIAIANPSANTSLSTSSRLIGENANTADFTNTYKTVTPMGIALNNLPFILMIVLAAGAFVAFVVVKSRKKAYSSNH